MKEPLPNRRTSRQTDGPKSGFLLACYFLLATFFFLPNGSAQSNQSYSISLPGGGNGNYLIANQLDHGSNSLNELLPNMPDGAQIQKWNCSLQDFDPAVATYSSSFHRWDTNFTLVPGEGAFLIPNGSLASITFTGTPHVPVLPAVFPCGNGEATMLSRQTNGPGDFQNITGLTPADGVLVQLWDPNILDFQVYAFYGGTWYPSVPSVAIGGAALITLPGQDTNPCPIGVQCPNNIVVQSSTNVAVNYSATVSNACGLAPMITVTFYPPSGSMFAPGTTTRVVCVAYRSTGHAASCAFNVTVAPPSQSYTINIHTGLNLLANQLDHGSNALNEVMPSVPDGSVLYKYSNSNGSWAASSFSAATGQWLDGNALTLSPGEGAFLQSPVSFTLTFTGLPQATLLPVTVPFSATYLLSRQTPDLGDYEDIVGTYPPEETVIFRWDSVAQDYAAYEFLFDDWIPFEPASAAGEAIWISPSGAPPPPIAVPPLIARQPASLTVEQGATATFTVVAAGAAPLSYQWLSNGIPVSAATNNNYGITNAQISAAASYGVVVSNLLGTVASSNALLSVAPVLSYAINLSPGFNLIANHLDHGSNMLNEIMPGVLDGSVVYKYNNASSNWTSSAYSSAAGSWIPYALTLNPGEGAWFQSPTNFTLTLHGRGHLPVLPLNIPTGSAWLLSNQTNALGYYTNIVGGAPVNGAKWYSYNGSNQTYTIHSYSAGSGQWTGGEPVSPVGEAVWISLSGTAPPPINARPIITQGPSSISVRVGESATFTVMAVGIGSLSYQWQFNGIDIPGATNSTWVISQATLGDSGMYDAKVGNGAGSQTSGSAQLTVLGPQCCDNKVWAFIGPAAGYYYTFNCPECDPYPCNGTGLGGGAQIWPTARFGHTLVVENYSSQGPLPNSLMLFGGYDLNGAADTIAWRLVDNSWQPLCFKNAPPARYFHAMTYDSWRKTSVLFGGVAANNTPLLDTWEWDGRGQSWNNLTPATITTTGPNANCPPARSGHAMAYDSVHHRIVLFGGAAAGGTLLNDTWLWDSSTSTWKTGPSAPAGLTPRQGHAMVYDEQIGAVVLFGGNDGAPQNDMWQWDGTDGTTWTMVMQSLSTPPPNQPAQRANHAMSYDPDCGQILLFGGFDSTGHPLNDTWLYDDGAQTWSQSSLNIMPVPRGALAVAYSSPNRCCTLIGGNTTVQAQQSPVPANDVWFFAQSRFLNQVNNGVCTNQQCPDATTADLWTRELYTKRFSWHHIRRFNFDADHAFTWTAAVNTDPQNTLMSGAYPSSGTYLQERAKFYCSDNLHPLGYPCAGFTLQDDSDCRWAWISALMYKDYALGDNFCPDIALSMDFYKYENDDWYQVANDVESAFEDATGCATALVDTFASGGWAFLGLKNCFTYFSDADTAYDDLVKWGNGHVPLGKKKAKLVASLRADNHSAPFFESPPVSPNGPCPALGQFTEIYENRNPEPNLTVSVTDPITHSPRSLTYGLSYTFRDAPGAVDTFWLMRRVGFGASVGTPSCATLLKGPPCSPTYFEFDQLSGAELRFKVRVAGPSLSNAGQLLGEGGQRTFFFYIDADNNTNTGSQCCETRGADYYVAIEQIMGSDCKSINTYSRICKWNPCLPNQDTCSPFGDWQSTDGSLVYDLKIAQTELDVTVPFRAVGDPQGCFSAWMASITTANNITINHCGASVTNGCRIFLPNNCGCKMQITRQPDGVCPVVQNVEFSRVMGGQLTAPIVVTFNKPMAPVYANQVTILPNNPAIAVFLDSTWKKLLIYPASHTGWAPGSYAVTLDKSIRDTSGNFLAGAGDDKCGTPYTFNFCVPDLQFIVTDDAGNPTTSFDKGKSIYVAGTGFPPPPAYFTLYLVQDVNVHKPNRLLADWTTIGAKQVQADASGVLSKTLIGIATEEMDYKVVAHFNNNTGSYDPGVDRVYPPCGAGFSYGEECTNLIEEAIAAWWPMEEASVLGPVNEVADADHGLVMGTDTSLVAGKVGQARSFNSLAAPTTYIAVPDGLDFDHLLNFGASDFSIEMWVSTSQTTEAPLVDKRTGGGNFNGYYFYLLNGQPRLEIGSPLGSGNVVQSFHSPVSTPTVADGNWHHVAVTVDQHAAFRVKFYVDAVPYSPAGTPLSFVYQIQNTSDLWIARSHANASYYSGALDEVTIYEVPLTPDQVAYIHYSGSHGKCPDLDSPVIDRGSPVNLTNTLGNWSLFNVSAISPFPVTYQWFKDGVPLVDGQFVTGATSNVLNFRAVSLADGGVFSVQVKSIAGTATSAGDTLTLMPASPASTVVGITNLSWKYLANGSNPAPAWTQLGYDDSLWSSGTGLFGFESASNLYPYPFRTPVSPPAQGGPITTYYRSSFQWYGATNDVNLVASVFIEDGAVFNLNGTEVGRLRVPANQTPSSLASPQPNSGQPETVAFPPGNLVRGANILAVEVHQSNPSANHDVFGMSLNANVSLAAFPTLTTTLSGRNLAISWSGPGTLQSALSLSATGAIHWTDVPVLSPYIIPMTNPGQFYRLRVP